MARSRRSRPGLAAPAARSEVAASAPGPGAGSSAGSVDTLRPTPTTTASPADSARMPHSLASPARTSFGHFRLAWTPVTAGMRPGQQVGVGRAGAADHLDGAPQGVRTDGFALQRGRVQGGAVGRIVLGSHG